MEKELRLMKGNEALAEAAIQRRRRWLFRVSHHSAERDT